MTPFYDVKPIITISGQKLHYIICNEDLFFWSLSTFETIFSPKSRADMAAEALRDKGRHYKILLAYGCRHEISPRVPPSSVFSNATGQNQSLRNHLLEPVWLYR